MFWDAGKETGKMFGGALKDVGKMFFEGAKEMFQRSAEERSDDSYFPLFGGFTPLEFDPYTEEEKRGIRCALTKREKFLDALQRFSGFEQLPKKFEEIPEGLLANMPGDTLFEKEWNYRQKWIVTRGSFIEKMWKRGIERYGMSPQYLGNLIDGAPIALAEFEQLF